MTKGEAELNYWLGRYNDEKNVFINYHYEYFYTEHFHLAKEDFTGKRILDIGCGPRGSLEWADNALVRIGIDPLNGVKYFPQYDHSNPMRRYGILSVKFLKNNPKT